MNFILGKILETEVYGNKKNLQIADLQVFVFLLSFFVQQVLRRGRDSNPRYLAVQRFSRPPRSTTLPPLQCLCPSKAMQRQFISINTQNFGHIFSYLDTIFKITNYKATFKVRIKKRRKTSFLQYICVMKLRKECNLLEMSVG